MQGTKFDNVLETIGNTPVVRLQKLAPEGVNVYVKVEAFTRTQKRTPRAQRRYRAL